MDTRNYWVCGFPLMRVQNSGCQYSPKAEVSLNRPNLVLDLMEEFRPVVVDAIAIAIIQSQVLDPADFEPSPDGDGIWLGTMAKKLFLTELERHFNTAFIYPPQNRNLRLSQILVEQARSLARCFVERSLDYQPYVIK